MFPQYLGEFFIEPILIADFERELMAFGEFPQEGTQAREELGGGLAKPERLVPASRGAALVAVNSTMNGRHVAPWAVYADDGVVDTVFPPTHKTFAMTQSHWFRIEDGQITEHWSNRDDLGMARQLGWIPPTPAYLFNMARANRRAKRS